jgi:hypothetical protein
MEKRTLVWILIILILGALVGYVISKYGGGTGNVAGSCLGYDPSPEECYFYEDEIRFQCGDDFYEDPARCGLLNRE